MFPLLGHKLPRYERGWSADYRLWSTYEGLQNQCGLKDFTSFQFFDSRTRFLHDAESSGAMKMFFSNTFYPKNINIKAKTIMGEYILFFHGKYLHKLHTKYSVTRKYI